jgi:nitroreductase/FMN reductase [NAD(P)H]
MPWVAQAARFLVVWDSRRIRRICELRDIPFANDHLDAFLNATTDAALVPQNLIRAASAAGLGACPIGVVRNHAMRIAELLALPIMYFRWQDPAWAGRHGKYLLAFACPLR